MEKSKQAVIINDDYTGPIPEIIIDSEIKNEKITKSLSDFSELIFSVGRICEDEKLKKSLIDSISASFSNVIKEEIKVIVKEVSAKALQRKPFYVTKDSEVVKSPRYNNLKTIDIDLDNEKPEESNVLPSNNKVTETSKKKKNNKIVNKNPLVSKIQSVLSLDIQNKEVDRLDAEEQKIKEKADKEMKELQKIADSQNVSIEKMQKLFLDNYYKSYLPSKEKTTKVNGKKYLKIDLSEELKNEKDYKASQKSNLNKFLDKMDKGYDILKKEVNSTKNKKK